MWNYNKTVMNHFLEPRNVGEVKDASAVGEVGNMSCGDALKLSLQIDENEIITDAKFQTFGCASAIASSSALTEIVIGKTVAEAKSITNRDIVDVLGELPEEKIHCSVMGMEALEAAIANYYGEEVIDDEDHDGEIICNCFGVTDTHLRKVAKGNNVTKADDAKNYCKAGGACGLCLDKIQIVLDDLWNDVAKEKDMISQAEALTPVQKIMKIQEVIDKEIKPILEQDGGSIMFINLADNIVQVKLQGKCSMCSSAEVTLKNTVQAKIQEFVDKSLIVEAV